jgi:CubicO group peptidase (beta-lactamase class C family)
MNDQEKWTDLEQLIVERMQKMKIPGLSVAIIKDQEIIYSKGFGNRDYTKNLPVTPDTLFGIGSCTKLFTCLAIMQLAEQGKLSTDDPVKNYIPLKIGIEEKPVKIRHLMSHSSGIPNLGAASVQILRHAPIEETWVPLASKDDLYTFINGAQDEIADEPEKRYFYFNTGFTMLGEIVEAVSGLNFADYVTEYILTPLEMNRSTFYENDFEKDDNRMTAFLVEKDQPVEKKHPFDKYIHAAGGLLSSVNEMSNFLVMLMNQGKFNDKQIISPESLNEIFSIQIETPVSFLGRSGYGFGVAISEDFLGYKLVSHGGSTGLSSAQFSFIPELNIGMVTEANVGSGFGIQIGKTILCKLLGKIPEDEIPFFKIESKMEKFAGEYKNYKGLTKIKILLENGMLTLETRYRDIPSRFPLIPEDLKISNNRFYIYIFGSKTPVLFEEREKDQIDVFIERNRFHKFK